MGHGQWGTEVAIVQLFFFFSQLNSSGLNLQDKWIAAWYLRNAEKRDKVY